MSDSIIKNQIQPDSRTLSEVNNGESVRVEALLGEIVDCQRLREMGFCEQAKIMRIAGSKALICKVCDSRVVISEALAKNVVVENWSEGYNVRSK